MIINLQNRFEIIEKICKGSSKLGHVLGSALVFRTFVGLPEGSEDLAVLGGSVDRFESPCFNLFKPR